MEDLTFDREAYSEYMDDINYSQVTYFMHIVLYKLALINLNIFFINNSRDSM